MAGATTGRGAAVFVAAALLALALAAADAGVAPTRARAATTYYVGNADGTNSVAVGCTSAANTTCTLRGALARNASDGGGGTVRFGDAIPAAPAATTIAIVVGGTLVLDANVALDGTGKRVAINGGGAGGAGVFQVNGGVVASLTALAVTRGSTTYGGIYNLGTLTLTGCTVSGNIALGPGGGVYNLGTLTVADSTVSGNVADVGGGIYNAATLTATNTTIAGNTAVFGGGILNYRTVALANVTVSGNTARNAGGGGGGGNLGGAVTSRSAIIAGNTNGDVLGTLDAASMHTLIGDGTGGLVNGRGGNIVGTGGTPLDPRLAPLGDHGGGTPTRPPLPGSPAIDAGGAGCTGADQRGLPRPALAGCDIGAVESRGFTLVATGGTPQRTAIGTAFAAPLAVAVAGNAVAAGIAEPVSVATGGGTAAGVVTFALPASGASGTFGTRSGCTNDATDTAATCAIGAGGRVTGPPITANLAVGAYTATAATAGGTTVAAFALTNALPALVVTPASLPPGTVGVPYSQRVGAAGGTGGDYTLAVTDGTLPAGLTLAANGTLSGTPTTAGDFTFTVRAADGAASGTRTYTVAVGPATVTSVAVTGGVPNIPAGGAVQLALTAAFTDGTTRAVTGGAVWMSSDASRATVDGTGRVTALAPGSATITASYMGKASTFALTITAPGAGGLLPNPAPVTRPDAAPTAPAAPVPPAPPLRAAAPGGGAGPQGEGATPPPRPAPPVR